MTDTPEKGLTGEVGETGKTGATGDTGDTGARGRPGEVGKIGETGAVGAVGETGAVGPAGPRATTNHFNMTTMLAVAVMALAVLVLASLFLGQHAHQQGVNKARQVCQRAQIGRIHATVVDYNLYLLTQKPRPGTPKITAQRITAVSTGELATAVNDAEQVEPQYQGQLPQPLQHFAQYDCIAANPPAGFWGG